MIEGNESLPSTATSHPQDQYTPTTSGARNDRQFSWEGHSITSSPPLPETKVTIDWVLDHKGQLARELLSPAAIFESDH